MDKYIQEVSENIYKFDLGKFLRTQGLIYHKFELEAKGIDLIDKYLFHILEEIHEVNNELNEKEKAKELIDVIMYLGSTYYTLFQYDDFDYKVITTGIEKIDVKCTTDKLFATLINARRMFPERKWHKEYKEENIISDRNVIFSEIIIVQILRIVELLLTNYDLESINTMIENKQRFIKHL
jgi:DNA polymerase elongation subunit (family B)